jgi:ABC-type amino acid transport substrate-binding protein
MVSVPAQVGRATNIKHHRDLFVIVLFTLLLAACGSPTPEPLPTLTPQPPKPVGTMVPTVERPGAADDSWRKVQQAGVLRVGTSADYPPFEYDNDEFQLDGFDIALIQAIGQQLGLKVELNDFAFDGLPTAVAIDQLDVAIGALSVTPARQAIADFSNVYYASDDAVLSTPGCRSQGPHESKSAGSQSAGRASQLDL